MKKIISYLLIIAMSLTLFSTNAANALTKEDAKISLTDALKIAKDSLNLKTEGYDINSGFREERGKTFWTLAWTSKDKKNPSNINVSVDANNGDITNFNKWVNNEKIAPKIPKYSKAQALIAAENFIKKLQKDKLSQVKLVETQEQRLMKYNFLDGDYYFNYIRVINGLEYADNNFNLTIDKNTLEVKSYSFTWNYSEFPAVDKAMTIDAAKKIFKEKLGVELSYHLIYKYDGKKSEPILVYMLKNGNRSIDAVTGELLNERYVGPYFEKNMVADKATSSGAPITPEEQKIIDENGKFLTRDKALETAKKYLNLAEKFTIDSANLMKDYYETTSWNLAFRYNDEATKTSGNAYVRINATSGELLSFYLYDSVDNPAENIKPKYTLADCKKIAEDYIDSLQKDKLSASIYKPYDYQQDDKNLGEYSFRYVRTENKVPFAENGFTVSVNAYTGKVSNYTMNWNTFTFPSANGALDLDKVYEILFSKQAFVMKYVTTVDDKGNDVIKLSYSLNSYSGLQDGLSGQILDASGKPVKEVITKEFTDISKSTYANDIKLLVSMGIIDTDSDKFNPTANIMQKDFIKYVVKSLNPYISTYSQDETTANNEYDTYYEEAISRKLITEADKAPNAVITRQLASKIVVRSLGIGFIGDRQGLFVTNFKDNSKLNSKYANYAAIAANLKLLEPVKGYFYPTKQLTRGETAGLIVKLLKVDTNINN